MEEKENMALQVWLPFTDGTLKQQGLNSASATVGGTVNLTNAGKLGKCATIGTAAGGITLPASTMQSFTECSVAFWIKIISWYTSYATFFQAGLGSTPWNNYIFGILRYGNNSNLCFSLTNSNGSSTSASYTSSNLEVGQWYHLAFTYKAGTVCIYKNGVLDKTYNTTYVPNFAGITHISIGRCTDKTSYQTNCEMNDFRIYDHCLSEMEVKQLSQGLVLHYPLNRGGWGQKNLLKNSSVENSHRYNSNSLIYYYYDFSGNLPTGTYTCSFDIKSSNGKESAYCSYATNANTIQRICSLTNISSEWTHYSFTFNVTSTSSNDIFFAHYTGHGSPFNAKNEGYIYVKNIKLENGSIETPWSPAESDTLATTMGLNGITEYDTSGYCNNGTWHGTHTNTSDTPKYAVSTTATGSASTYLEGPILPAEAQTAALWIKCKKSQNAAIFNDKTTGLQIGLLNSLLYMNSKTSTAGFTTTHWKDDDWNHVVVTYDGTTRKAYVNGQPETQSGASNYYIHNADNCWLWNRSYNNNYPFNGSLSDLRIYATALSADDVKSLYQNCATIDPDGTIRGQIRS